MSELQQNSSSSPSWILSILADATLVPFLLSIAIGLPSALLYMLQTILIIKKRRDEKLNSSFLAICASKAIASLLGLLSSFFYLRFGRLGIFMEIYLKIPSFLLVAFCFLFNYSVYAEHFATIALLLDRLTAIAFPHDYERIWDKLLSWAIAAIFLLPLPIVWHLLYLDEFVHVQADGTFTIDTHQRELDDSTKLAFIFTIVSAIICLCINVASLLFYRYRTILNRQQNDSNHQNASQGKVQRKLTIYTVVTFLGQLIYSIYLVLLYASIQLLPSWGVREEMTQLIFLSIFNQLPWVYDLCFVAMPSWLLLWAHKPLRMHIGFMFSGIKLGPVQAWTN